MNRLLLPLLPGLALAVPLGVHDAGGAPASDPAAELDLERLRALRDEIAPDVEELRGLEFREPVDVRITSKEEFLAYARERAERMTSAGQRDAAGEVARLLDLVPADMDVEEAGLELVGDQALGYYEPSEDAFFVVDAVTSEDILRVLLAHELTHALDDQHFDIDGHLEPLMRTNGDAAMAYHAVVEGSGTDVNNRWLMPRLTAGEISLDAVQEAGELGGGEGAPEYLWKPLFHSYFQGTAFLARTENRMAAAMGGADPGDVTRAFRDPPASTEQVLHPDKYWDDDERDEPRAVSVTAEGLPEGWELVGEDTFGELGMALLTTPPDEREELGPETVSSAAFASFTNAAAAGWDGDRYALLRRGDALVLRLVSVWDDEEHAREMAEALRGMRERLVARGDELGDGRTVVAVERLDARVELTVAHSADAADVAEVTGALRFRIAAEPEPSGAATGGGEGS